MSIDLLLALMAFAFVTSVTPGPNNLMLLASGVNFGFRRTVPHMLGINVGFPVMIALVGLGLGRIFEIYPMIYTVLRVCGGAYMLWLAYRIAMSGPAGNGTSSATPMNFMQAALFQWVNPKAWITAVTAIAAYTSPVVFGWTVLSVALAFAIVGGPSSVTWTLFGSGLRRFLDDPRYHRIFNVTMALLLVASLAPLLYH